MKTKDINIAFIKEVVELANQHSIPIIHENETVNNMSFPAIELFLLPNKPEYPTVGNNGEHYNEGIYQLNIINNLNKGNGESQNIADLLTSHFARNYTLTDSNINIVDSYVTRGYKENEYYKVPVSIEYRSWNA